jgi:eukaryotic translation initiation factor 2-alpha kinase 4
VARHDLVPWLQERIAEQKRIDVTTSGVEHLLQGDLSAQWAAAPSNAGDVQLLLPGYMKRARGGPGLLFSERGLDGPRSGK